MRTIFKYPLQVTDAQSLTMPTGAKPLCVQLQHGQPYLWAQVDTERPAAFVSFMTFGTGHPMPESEPLHYVGTYQLEGGALVFHVFEVLR